MDFSRKTAFDVLVEIEKNGSYSNLALNRFIGETQTEKQPSYEKSFME